MKYVCQHQLISDTQRSSSVPLGRIKKHFLIIMKVYQYET
jgi:hypothetical protein